MSLVSEQFLLFLGVLILVYFLCPGKYQWIVLLTGSCIFYMWASVKYMPFLVFTALTTWAGSLWLSRMIAQNNAYLAEHKAELSREEKKSRKAQHTKRKRVVVALVCVLNFGVLCAVKYTGFLIENLNVLLKIFHTECLLDTSDILIPMGISFYTFQAVGYLFDVYREKEPAERNFAKLLLFLSFFPQVVQGPISRHKVLAPQLLAGHRFDGRRAEQGALLLLWGFFKKLLIADRVAVISNAIFAVDSGYHGMYVLLGTLAYSARVYADFSGGMDIARGAAQILGIELPLNFERPYFATTIGDFWRRWHITLGAWFRDYVFYPVSLSSGLTRLGKWVRQHVNGYVGKLVPALISQFLVFFLIGIWHGSSWKYFAFGLYHGMLIVGGLLLGPKFKILGEKLHLNMECLPFRIYQILRTLLLVCFGRILTMGGRLLVSLRLMKSLFLPDSISCMKETGLKNLGLSAQEWWALLAAILVLFAVSLIQERAALQGGSASIRQKLADAPCVLRWLVVWGLFFGILVFGIYGYGYSGADFIYRGF